jgi:hypothetical protein
MRNASSVRPNCLENRLNCSEVRKCDDDDDDHDDNTRVDL